MSVETQAAISAAQAAADNAQVAWALFWINAALLVVTVGAFLVGARAATSAAETYRLEAEPVIMVQPAEALIERVPASKFVPGDRIYLIDGNPSLRDGLVLRKRRSNDANIERPRVVLEFQNIGRSPAIDLRIAFDLAVPMRYKRGVALPPGF